MPVCHSCQPKFSNCHKITRGIVKCLSVQMELLKSEIHQEDLEDLNAHTWRARDLTTSNVNNPRRESLNLTKMSDAPRNWVVDLSSKGLEPHECELLERGLKYAVTPKQIPVESLIASAEDGIESKSGPDVDLVRLKMAGVLANTKPTKSNLPSSLHHSIKTLRERSDMICLPAGKGRWLGCDGQGCLP